MVFLFLLVDDVFDLDWWHELIGSGKWLNLKMRFDTVQGLT